MHSAAPGPLVRSHVDRSSQPTGVNDRLKTVRNVAIVALIAAAIYLLPGGGRASHTFLGVVYVGFAVAIGYLGLRLYREHRVALHSLGDAYRGLLYGAIAFAVLAWAARARMWESGLGELLWFVLVGAIVYTFLAVYRHWRAY
jgi:hypothetical protein